MIDNQHDWYQIQLSTVELLLNRNHFMHILKEAFSLDHLEHHNQLHFSTIIVINHNSNLNNYNELELNLKNQFYNQIPLSSLILISGFKSFVGISNNFSTSLILFCLVFIIRKWLFSFFYYHQPYQADLWRFFSLAKYSLLTEIFSTYLISYTLPLFKYLINLCLGLWGETFHHWIFVHID